MHERSWNQEARASPASAGSTFSKAVTKVRKSQKSTAPPGLGGAILTGSSSKPGEVKVVGEGPANALWDGLRAKISLHNAIHDQLSEVEGLVSLGSQ